MRTYFDRHGALRVCGGRLVDAAGQPVQLRGVSTLGLAWYPGFVTEDAFRTLRDDWGRTRCAWRCTPARTAAI